MNRGRTDDFSFFAERVLNWVLNLAVFGLLYLIAAKVLSNLPSLLNIITL